MSILSFDQEGTSSPLPRRPLVLLGGGLDSTALLLWLLQGKHECRGMFIHYGQRAGKEELKAVEHFCNKYKVPLTTMWVPLHQIADSAILIGGNEGSNKLEGRNVIFVALAATHAATVGCTHIALGYHQEPEDAPFPDATLDAVKAMQGMLDVAYSAKIRIWTPFSLLTRKTIFDLGCWMDKDFLTHTHTCYTGKPGGCGVCSHCVQRASMEEGNEHNARS